MKKIKLCLVIAGLLALSLLACGCQEQQKVWGKGEPSEEWLGFFDNSNISRLNYFQTQVIDNQAMLIADLVAKVKGLEEVTDPNFVELNARQHEKMGETDIRFHKRILALEAAQPETDTLLIGKEVWFLWYGSARHGVIVLTDFDFDKILDRNVLMLSVLGDDNLIYREVYYEFSFNPLKDENDPNQ